MSDIIDMMSDDAKAGKTSGVTEDNLGRLAKLAQIQISIEDAIERIEEDLKQRKAELIEVSEKQIPDLFDEMGLGEIKLDDGAKVKVDRSFASSISKKNQPEAFSWLRGNGHGSLIKHTLGISLNKGDDELAGKISAYVTNLGLTVTDKEAVHPSTLKAFVREQMEQGSDIPQDVFSVYPVAKTKITR